MSEAVKHGFISDGESGDVPASSIELIRSTSYGDQTQYSIDDLLWLGAYWGTEMENRDRCEASRQEIHLIIERIIEETDTRHAFEQIWQLNLGDVALKSANIVAKLS
ncbi:MAG: hypothetical protein JWN33_96 [Candidatus Saccharibacteria bacterium]|nr:hypothetical protein [Candidatus Saccharibacteria bacterium]